MRPRAGWCALAQEAELARPDDGRDDLLFLPYLSGERTPINDPDARGVVAGLSLHAGRGDLYRGLLQGIAYAARHNLERMRAVGGDVRRVVAVGGGTTDRAFLQLVSDATGVTQVVPASTIGAARGDAFLAGLAAGLLSMDDLAAWVRFEGTVTPAAATAPDHDRRYVAFRKLYDETRETVHGLVGRRDPKG
jgi:xylulokinase